MLLLLLPPPLPPPLFPEPPFPPRLLLPLDKEEEEAPGDEDPATVILPTVSPLEERFSPCFPSVRGGGGFRGAVLDPLFPLLLLPGLPEVLVPRPDLPLAILDKPAGLVPEEGGVDLPLPP